MSYSNRDVIHAWANWTPGARVDSRRSSNGHSRFHGRELFSYGTCIAKHVSTQNDRAGRVVFITTRRYSATTSGKHMPGAHDIPAGAAVFHVDDVQASGPISHKANLAAMLAAIETEARRLTRARSGTSTDRLADMVAAAESYRQAFLRSHVRKPVTMPGPDFLAECEARHRKVRAAEAATRARMARDRAERDAEALAAWLAGDRNVHRRFTGPVQFRVIDLNGKPTVESTLGARVPLADALRVAALAERCVANREIFLPSAAAGPIRDRYRVGDFHLDRIGDDGTVTIGCHVFTIAEIRRAVAAAGLTVPAAEAA